MIQTTSPEIGQQLEKALRDAGYKFKPFLKWYNNNIYTGLGFCDATSFEFDNPWETLSPAVTMRELWQMIPNSIENGNGLKGFKTILDIQAGYSDIIMFIRNNDICDALATLALWCIENNHPLNLPKND